MELSQDEEDDDAHLCLRCRKTIHGLDNYIVHRRTFHQNNFFQSLNLHQINKSTSSSTSSPTATTTTSSSITTTSSSSTTTTDRNRCDSAEDASFFMESIGLEPIASKRTLIDDVLSGSVVDGFLDPDLLEFYSNTNSNSVSNTKKPSLLSFLRPGKKETTTTEAGKSSWQEDQSSWLDDVLYQELSGNLTESRCEDDEDQDDDDDDDDDEEEEVVEEKKEEEEEEYSYACEMCHKNFNDKDSYQRHLTSTPHLKRNTATNRKQNIKRDLIKCSTCLAQVNSYQYGKHLISHFHHHRSLDLQEANKTIVLEYIEDIVKEAPYKCQMCSFYCNWHHEFLNHWRRCHLNHNHHHNHLLREDAINQFFWCSFCRFQTVDSSEMFEHLSGGYHEEIVAVINRSVPIVIRKIELIPCTLCDKRFRLRISYKRHRLKYHGEKESTTIEIRKCDICSDLFPSIEEHKRHVLTEHSTLCPQCAICGSRFASPQDLGVHVRNKSCFSELSNKTGIIRCRDCEFDCDTENMLYFHRALRHPSEGENNERRRCPVCGKIFSKHKLWQHLKIHGERHRCDTCYRLFNSDSELHRHRNLSGHGNVSSLYKCSQCSYQSSKRHLRDLHFRRNHISRKKGKMTSMTSDIATKKKCAICGSLFSTNSEFKSHLLSHTNAKPFVCSLCGTFRAKRMSELNRHKRIRHRETGENHHHHHHKCGQCDYSTHSKQHLDRHVTSVHRSVDLFHCKLCPYKCSTVENLRKHILKTKKHGQRVNVYICDLCTTYRTDSGTEYGRHLFSQHGCTDYKDKVRDYFKPSINKKKIADKQKCLSFLNGS